MPEIEQGYPFCINISFVSLGFMSLGYSFKELLNKGIKCENIFVLTYMDSAARNFRERIKNMSPDSTQLPNISTIHGLALRIIKENSNYERLNLDSDFEICDDTQRMRILKSIDGKYTKTELETIIFLT